MAKDNITPIKAAPPAPPKDDDESPSGLDISHEIKGLMLQLMLQLTQ